MANYLTTAFNRIPAPLLVILGIVSTNTGAALSKDLFVTLGVLGTVTLQFAFGAIILLVVTKPQLHKLPKKTLLLVFLNGLALCVLEAFYFQTVAHLPLGIAVTIGFCGPLFLALIGSRTFLDAIWLLLASIGLFIIAPIDQFQQDASVVGYIYAVLYALGLCLYIVTSKFLGNNSESSTSDFKLVGLQGLAAAITVSAIVIMPFGIASSGMKLLNPRYLLTALGLALITMILTYAFQYTAITKLTTKSFGILSSSRPIVAALIGLIILGDSIDMKQIASFSLIITASIGSITMQNERRGSKKNIPDFSPPPFSQTPASGLTVTFNRSAFNSSSLNKVVSKEFTELFVIPLEDLSPAFRREYDL